MELREKTITSLSIFKMIPGNIDLIKGKKTLEERLNGEIWMRSPPLLDHPPRISGKKTIKRAFFERIGHYDQRKMIIYLNA